VLWSGGAADCVIVAAVGGSGGWIAHVDRLGPEPDRIASQVKATGAGQVYLASAIFASPRPADNKIVRDIMTRLAADGIGITAIYPYPSLALDVANGAVRANLSLSDRTLLAAGSGFAALTERVEAKRGEEKEKEPPPT
jgi:hypothetical protein